MRIEYRNDENSPRAERIENFPDKMRVAGRTESKLEEDARIRNEYGSSRSLSVQVIFTSVCKLYAVSQLSGTVM